jgi:hypothetical protein
MALHKINGRIKSYSRITSVACVKPGRFTVAASHGIFRIEGGRAAGGAHRDWFLSQINGNDIYNGTIHTTSLVAALDLIDNV